MAAFLVSTKPWSPEAAWTALGLLDVQLVQQLLHPLVDELRSVVGMKALNREGELGQQTLQHGQQIGLRDARRGQHHFPLRHFIDGVDVVDAFLVRTITLMHRVDA